jgi:hypothetical protein
VKPYENSTISELLGMSLNEDVFERILGILDREQHRKNEKPARKPESQSLRLPLKTTA